VYRGLGICGSLRTGSLNAAALGSIADLCGEAGSGGEFERAPRLDLLPFFNPDVERGERLPEAVLAFRARVAAADAVLIATPEYAHGTSGVLKNALEWLVGGGELVGKPVALLSASPASTGGGRAQAWLRETLTVMSAEVLPRGLEIPLAPAKAGDGRITHVPTLDAMRELLDALAQATADATAATAAVAAL
jgi:NAD(P)H-dependent FMN reductase